MVWLLACKAVNWISVTLEFRSKLLEKWINTNCKVEFNEEENDANFGDLETEEHPNEPEWKADDQKEDITNEIREEKASRALKIWSKNMELKCLYVTHE